MYLEDDQRKTGNPVIFRLQEIFEVPEGAGLVVEQEVTNFRYMSSLNSPKGNLKSLLISDENQPG